MTRVFVDTSGFIALLDRDDPRQAAVTAAFAAHELDGLVTHGYVVAESLAVARRRFGAAGVLTLLDDVLPAIELTEVPADLHRSVQRVYRASLPSAISFVDRVSIAVMERDGLDRAIALDPDLAMPGLTIEPNE